MQHYLRLFSRIIYLALFLIVLLLTIGFTLKNQHSVELFYFFDLHWAAPLGVLTLVALSIGIGLGVLLTAVWVLRVKRQIARVRRDYRKIEQEVANLRALPIKDEV